MKKIISAVCVLTILAFGATSVMAKEAADIFKRKCAHCHGLKGEGLSGLTATLKGSQFITKSPDAEIKTTIQEGRIGDSKKFKKYPVIMYPVKDLTEAELDSLVRYLKVDLQK